MNSKRAIILQKNFLISTKEEKQKRASSNWRRLNNRQVLTIKSKLNSLKTYIYFEALSNYSGRIIIVRRESVVIGTKQYKNFDAKMKISDIKWNEVIEELYAQEFLKLNDELLNDYEINIKKTLLS